MSSTETLQRPEVSDPELEREPPRVAHIIIGDATGEVAPSAGTAVTEAYVLGTPVDALCGAVFVPSRDPKSCPVCQPCADLAKLLGRVE